MMDQSRRLSQPLRWGRRERATVGALLAVLALGLIGLGVFALTSGAPARKDCIQVTFASTLGVGVEHGCGASARGVCAAPQAFSAEQAQLREACRKAGFPFGG